MSGKLHIVTGISGVGVQDTLKKLHAHAQSIGHQMAVHISVESILRELAQPSLESLSLGGGGVLAVFELPQEQLRKLWIDALREAMGRAHAQLDTGLDVVLTMHLCYYHHKYRQYIVAANFELLRQAAKERVTSVVTLIDDVYDTQVQLSSSGQLFDMPEKLEDPYVTGMRVLVWRANEILVSAGLAAALQCPHYILAVKHPVATLHDLLYSTKKRVYLSHPISEVRRLVSAGRLAQANSLLKPIQELVAELSKTHIVFEPTTIDEFRFRSEATGDGTTGNLTLRWPFQADPRSVAWCTPDIESSPFNFPVGWEEDPRKKVKFTPVISEFMESVSRQINARDHWLVEQSDIIVCFRPIVGGHVSSGVRHELLHAERLATVEVGGPRVVVAIVPPEDARAFPAREFEETILERWYDSHLIEGTKKDLRRLCSFLRANPSDVQVTKVLSGNTTELLRLLRKFDLNVVPEHGKAGDGVLDSDQAVRRNRAAEELASSLRTELVPYFTRMSMVKVVEGSHQAVELLREN